MPQTYRVDQAATFNGVVLLSVEPKVTFGSAEQDHTSDGVPKWEIQCAAGFRQFGKVSNEILKVGIASHRNPGEGITPYSPVELVDFEIGIMPKERKDRETGQTSVVGVQVWYRCSDVRALSTIGGRKPFAVASGDS
jgi:hypothetical protein